MKISRRGMVIGAGAACIAGAALFGLLTQFGGEAPSSAAGVSVCLKADIPFVEGATKRCYTPAEAAALADRPVLDEQNQHVRISLSHPTDLERGLETAGTCAEYRTLKNAGWYALSTREMRREAVFERACGVIAMLEQAQPAEVSYFENDALSKADLRSLSDHARFGFGPEDDRPGGGVEISTLGDGVWLIAEGDQRARIEEIAHADFTTDGRADMLVFVTVSVKDGTATASRVGLLDKPAATGPVMFVEREK
ncbi:MAG: hypothetical protein AB7P23_02440 [Amphiplicatus sp.]